MARPYGRGEVGGWGERWGGREEDGGGERRFGPGRRDWPGSERDWVEQTERRYGGEQGWQGDYARGFGEEGERRWHGRPPKGYRRSDERIRDDVSERIARAGVDADDVEVKVEGGEVTLAGTVQRREDKRWIEALAESVFGVHDVRNELRVARGAQPGTEGQGQSAPAAPRD